MIFENNSSMTMSSEDITKMNDFEKNYNKKGSKYFVWFYASWCGHCKIMEETWKQFVKKSEQNPTGIKVIKIESEHIKSHHNVYGFPTLRLYKNGSFIEYNGERNVDAFYSFLLQHSAKQSTIQGKKSKSKSKSKKGKKQTKKQTKKFAKNTKKSSKKYKN